MTYLRSLSLTLTLALLAMVAVNACSSDALLTCAYHGSAYTAGQSFPDIDGCNSCTCGANGTVSCTLIACAPDGGPDAAPDAGGETGGDAAPAVDAPAASEVGDVPRSADVHRDASSDVNPLCRVTDTFSFGFIGGLVASSDESTLSPPSQYHHVRMHFRSDGGTTMCDPVPDCQIMNALGLVEVVAGLQNADVQAALAQPDPLVYGHDSRPVDGQVYSVKRADGHGLLVGSACTGGELNCRPIPGGVAAWVQAWQAFDSRMLSRPECSAL